MLDVGCGTGGLYEYFERIGRRVDYVGVDISAKMIEAARAASGRGVRAARHPHGTARDPKAEDARYVLVVSLQRAKQLEEARAVALEAAPGALREMLDARTSSDPALVVAGYERALALAPRLVEACVLATVHEQRGQWKDAIALWTRALDVVPDDPAVRDRFVRAQTRS